MVTSANQLGIDRSHPRSHRNPDAVRYATYGALLILLGGLLSGPIGLVLVALIHPAGAWHGSRALAAGYHPIQTLPFFFGLVLVIGCDLVIAAAYQMTQEKDRTRAMLALVCAAAFTSLIVFNYICQTTFIPAVLTHYRSEDSVLVATLSLVNPQSLSWAIEMWGWGLFGVATWLVAPVFQRGRLGKVTAWAFTLNGIMSVAGALITAIDLTWVLTTPGMVNFILWNALMVVLALLTIVSLRTREVAVRRTE